MTAPTAARVTVGALLFTLAFGGCDGSDDSPFPGGIDCKSCKDTQACWYTEDFDGEISEGGCVELPADCAQNRSCDCINAAQENTCAEGMEQNTNACETIENVPVVECVSTLG